VDIHDPKTHTAMIGVISTVMVAAIGYGGVAIDTMQSAPPRAVVMKASHEWPDLASAGIPFGKHPYTIYIAEGAGELPYALEAMIEKSGDEAKTDSDIIPHEGIWVSPDTPDGHAVADAISKAIGEPVKVGNADGGAYEIGVGRPTHKKVAQ
jgi:hypothetical protein